MAVVKRMRTYRFIIGVVLIYFGYLFTNSAVKYYNGAWMIIPLIISVMIGIYGLYFFGRSIFNE